MRACAEAPAPIEAAATPRVAMRANSRLFMRSSLAARRDRFAVLLDQPVHGIAPNFLHVAGDGKRRKDPAASPLGGV